ncbi:MAG: hypothetical protein KDC55_02415 [Ignavibacteriae bacterium]|nr:hypothetical protein [Ignavibacteriota bacterium]
MIRLINILSLILIVLILIPVIGININTHICGQTNDVTKSIVIPGLISSIDCEKCHKAIVVKSCCSGKDSVKPFIRNKKQAKRDCCKDLKEFNEYDYLLTRFSKIEFSTFSFYLLNFIQVKPLTSDGYNSQRKLDKIRGRPYVADILTLNCSYLI